MPSTRPAPGGTTGPSLGANRPSLGGTGGRPSVNPPLAGRPGYGNATGVTRPNLPTTTLPGTNRPEAIAPLPSRPGLNQPGITARPGYENRPGLGERPSLGNLARPMPLPSERPSITLPSERPQTLPGNRPLPGERPQVRPDSRPQPLPENITRPGVNNRPITRPAERPTIGGPRPNRPGNINIGNSITNNNINNNMFVNRPPWHTNPGWARPGWGLNNNWNNNWYNHGINNHHHRWYNGCWHGWWGSAWYAPVSRFWVGWGLGSLSNNWGYSYFNPYFVATTAQPMVYDYSQPVVINTFSDPVQRQDGTTENINASPQETESLSVFDRSLEQFKSGNYVQAISSLNQVLKELPGDAVVHEVRCLCLFALGDYSSAAAGLSSLLTSAPGMDWTTMSGLYGDVDDYTQQLRRLEAFCEKNPANAAAHFVLAYHYLVIDSKENAIEALQVVVENQPKDVTAKRMLDALQPPAERKTPTPDRSKEVNSDQETDLVGNWLSKSGSTKIALTITEDSSFTWQTTSQGQVTAKLMGQLTASPEGIAFETNEQGTLAGSVQSRGTDSWLFQIDGAPPSDPGLSFIRSK